jgi:hypothetical protein
LNKSLELALLNGLPAPSLPVAALSSLLLALLTLLLVSSALESFLLLKAVEMKIRRLVFRSRIGGSGVGSGRFSVGGDAVNVAGLSRLNRIGSLSDKSALDVDEKELVSDDVDDEIGACLSSA